MFPLFLVAALGFSLGGLSNILFADQNKDIDAVVTLDSSVMSKGWLEDLKASSFYNPEGFTAKLLMISNFSFYNKIVTKN